MDRARQHILLPLGGTGCSVVVTTPSSIIRLKAHLRIWFKQPWAPVLRICCWVVIVSSQASSNFVWIAGL
ncbi:hypothetical protein V8C42DRAFT_321234, partial [Trichoderma barbatum]